MPGDEGGVGGLRKWVPRWWRGEAGWRGHAASVLLWPAEQLFRVGVAARNHAYDAGLVRSHRAAIPVVSVGNISVGGAGKTPFSAWLAARLRDGGHRPAIVLRGYGADEILVHGELNPDIPVYVAAKRLEAVHQAANARRDVVVLDDAFQHRALARDLDLVLVPADGWDDRPRMLPRGPWREDLAALKRADLVVVTVKAVDDGVARQVEEVVASRVGADRVVRCRLVPGELVGMGTVEGMRSRLSELRDRRVLAVASLADPGPFVAQVREAGVEVELAAFPDHHAFTRQEVSELVTMGAGRPLLMTRKEAVKLRPLLPADVEGWMLGQEVRIERGEELLDAALRRALRG